MTDEPQVGELFLFKGETDEPYAPEWTKKLTLVSLFLTTKLPERVLCFGLDILILKKED